MTLEEYLDAEERSQIRHEFVGGHMWAMTGGTKDHNDIAVSLGSALHGAARQYGCRVFINDVKLQVGFDVYYPDLMVTCDSSDDPRIETNPCLVVEVMSPSSRVTDRREKLIAYKRIDSLQTYLVIDPDTLDIEVHQRLGTRWTSAVLSKSDRLDLTCPPVTVDIATLLPR
jgi:Uma2 family endonuclease